VRLLFRGILSKDCERPETNEDVFDLATSGDVLALSDGASESYDSRRWAQCIVEAFIARPFLSSEWLAAVAENYARAYDVPSLSWSQAASYARGSFATLLGIRHPRRAELELIAVGDSWCALLDGDAIVRTFPYGNAKQFDERPFLLSSSGAALDDQINAVKAETWSLDDCSDPRLLCMTDALGRWFLESSSRGGDEWRTLLDCASEVDFKDLVVALRDSKSIKVDDTTFALLDEL